MPGDFSRKVARAAAVAGGRTYRSQSPRGWYAILLVICLVGVGLISYSRYQRTQAAPTPAAKPAVPPTAADQWEVAVAVDVCGSVLNNALVPTTFALGSAYQTLSHGVVNIEPSRATVPGDFEGKFATLESYLQTVGLNLNATTLRLQGLPIKQKPSSTTTSTSTSTTTSTTTAKSSSTSSTSSTSTTSSTTTTTTVPIGPARIYTAGKSTCSGAPGEVLVERWSSPTATHGVFLTPAKAVRAKFENGQLFTIGFVAKGTTSLPKPPGAQAVSQFMIANPLGRATGTTTPTVPATTPSTTTSTTSASSSTTTTTAKKSKKTKKS